MTQVNLMNLPDILPELEHYTISDNKTVYYLQKIIKYDEGHTHSSIIGVYGSLEGDIDKATQDAIRQAKEFCKYNEVKPHILTIRKIKATISSEEIASMYKSLEKTGYVAAADLINDMIYVLNMKMEDFKWAKNNLSEILKSAKKFDRANLLKAKRDNKANN